MKLHVLSFVYFESIDRVMASGGKIMLFFSVCSQSSVIIFYTIFIGIYFMQYNALCFEFVLRFCMQERH
jgi:hypothetical protein